MRHKRVMSISLAALMLVSLCAFVSTTSVSAAASSSRASAQAPPSLVGSPTAAGTSSPFVATYAPTALSTYNINPPSAPVRLVFIHHSTGQAWLTDGYGNLAIALRDNNYYVSDTNYGWGPPRPDGDAIGSHTDIGNWWEWFRGPNSATYLNALYANSEQTFEFSRLTTTPAGPNEIILFKSCFPNSDLKGGPNDPIPPISSNPLRGQDAGSDAHTVANAKGIYLDLLNYFSTRQDKLFIVITAPPVSDGSYASNARAFNQWLVNDYLKNYPYKNVFVFDYYNVLTTNGGNSNTNDLNAIAGNHHRWWNNAIQHQVVGDHNVTAYPTGDDHPSAAGDTKATGEFVPLLNIAYNQWKAKPLASAPAVCAQDANSLDVFAQGTDHALWHKRYQSGSGWGNWESLGGVLTSSPAATSPTSGVIDVFVRGTNGALYQREYNNGWQSWKFLGGQIAPGTGPAVSSPGSGRLDVFVQGTNGPLYHKWYAGSWSSWENLGGQLTSSPGAISWSSSRIDVFGRGTNGALYHKFYQNGWSSWENLGGQLAQNTGPALSSWAVGRLDVFVQGTNGPLYHKWYAGSWSSWENLGGQLTSSPGAVSRSSGTIDVFVRGGDNGLWEKTYNKGWGGWTSIRGT